MKTGAGVARRFQKLQLFKGGQQPVEPEGGANAR